ncbi:MAG: hypothetical protein U9N84_00220 [Actinomycetota bacterium]|nr:hypothetical protein [Actinomycetota bacterium]
MVSTSVRSSRAGHSVLPEPAFRSFSGLVRHVAIGGIAGLVAGIVVGGGGGRLFMRAAGAAARDAAQGARTEAGFTVGEVTFGGTVALILFIGVFVGVVGAALYLIFRPWLSWTGRWRGAAFGVLLFAAGSATSDVMNPDNVDFRILGNPVLLVGLISALFLAFGLALDALFGFLDTRLPAEEKGWRAGGVVYAVISGVGLLLVSGLPFAIFVGDSACSCTPPVIASWSVAVAGLGTLARWIVAFLPQLPVWTRSAAGVAGYGGTLGVLLFGLSRVVSDAADIISI